MEYRIKFNKELLWDYEIKEDDLEREEVLILYISRVLNNGNFEDVSSIPTELIQKFLNRLFLSKKVRKFWEWYLHDKK